jgi:hypothetical protein
MKANMVIQSVWRAAQHSMPAACATRRFMTLEIPPKNWKDFCDKLSTLKNVLLDIRAQSDGDLRMIAHDAPLKSAAFEDHADGCNSNLIIEFGSAGGSAQHWIVGPIRLLLRKQSEGDHYNLLEISAETGLTVIAFRPGLSPVFLEALQLVQPA